MNIKRWFLVAALVLMLSLVGLPVAAAQGGGVHFGDYVLAVGDSVSGDLTVFGSVTLKSESSLNGDLTVFGPLYMETGAVVDGDVTVLGEANIAGVIDGSAFVAGATVLRETARIEGDLSIAGALEQHPGAIIKGTFTPADSRGFNWDAPFTGPVFIPGRQARWVFNPTPLINLMNAVATLVIMALFSMLLASVWPKHLERAANTVIDAPWISMGMGFLALVVGAVIVAILIVTICLALFGFVGIAIGMLALAFGWVAMGLVVGERMLKSLFKQPTPSIVLSALVGTLTITLLAQLVSAFSCLGGLLLPLYALAVGVVLLTRFGTMPYAVRGSAVVMPSAPVPVAPVAPIEPVTTFDFADELSSPDGEA